MKVRLESIKGNRSKGCKSREHQLLSCEMVCVTGKVWAGDKGGPVCVPMIRIQERQMN
jgi:hypothetical protein